MNKVVADIIVDNAGRIPDRLAIIDQGRTFTFSQHADRVFRLVDALRQCGCRRRDRIAVLSRNCAEYLEIYGACEVGGFVATPVNHRLATVEIVHAGNNATPSVIFYAYEFTPVMNEARATLPGQILYIQTGQGDLPDWARSYESFIARGVASPPNSLPVANEPVYIVHTSGATGKPRGAVLSQASQYGTARAISAASDIAQDDRFLLVQPLFHVGAKFLQLAHHLEGAAVHIRQGFNPAAVWEALQKEGITTLQLVPTMIDTLLADEYVKHRGAARVKTIFYSTAPIREALLRKALAVFGPVFIQQYGSTEGGSISNLAKHQHLPGGTTEQQRRLLSAGQARVGVEIKILRSDEAVAGVGETGEILIRHPDIMQEYWNDAKATGEVLKDGWLAMGDIGYLDERGFLFIVDRKKDMIISGGENIYPREVEIALEQREEVARCAVIGIPDVRWGESVCAFVVLHEGAIASETDLIRHCGESIASYKKPKKIVFVEALPRTVTGKVDKVRLRSPYWQRHQRQVV